MNMFQVKRLKIDSRLREYIIRRDKYSCRYCGSKIPPFHLDHVYPVSKGGETSEENLVTSCVGCNTSKHTKIIYPKPIGYFEKDEKPIISLFNVFLCALGTSLMLNGVWGIPESYQIAFSALGMATILYLLFRLSVGRI